MAVSPSWTGKRHQLIGEHTKSLLPLLGYAQQWQDLSLRYCFGASPVSSHHTSPMAKTIMKEGNGWEERSGYLQTTSK